MTHAAHNEHSETRRPGDRDRIVTTGPSRSSPPVQKCCPTIVSTFFVLYLYWPNLRLRSVRHSYSERKNRTLGCDKAALFQWVQGPPGDSLPPEATGAGMEVTKCLKPPDSGHELVTARVCRPQRE